MALRKFRRAAATTHRKPTPATRRDFNVQKRLSRLSRRSLVGVIAGLAFAAAAGVGLAQITSSEPAITASVVSTTSACTGTQTSMRATSTVDENDAAAGTSDDTIYFERDADDNGTTS